MVRLTAPLRILLVLVLILGVLSAKQSLASAESADDPAGAEANLSLKGNSADESGDAADSATVANEPIDQGAAPSTSDGETSPPEPAGASDQSQDETVEPEAEPPANEDQTVLEPEEELQIESEEAATNTLEEKVDDRATQDEPDVTDAEVADESTDDLAGLEPAVESSEICDRAPQQRIFTRNLTIVFGTITLPGGASENETQFSDHISNVLGGGLEADPSLDPRALEGIAAWIALDQTAIEWTLGSPEGLDAEAGLIAAFEQFRAIHGGILVLG